MKRISQVLWILVSLLMFSSVAEARRRKSYISETDIYSMPSYDTEYQSGYFRKDGTYVNSHFKTKKNGTKRDNYSTYPNVNPYTGKRGRKKSGYNYY